MMQQGQSTGGASSLKALDHAVEMIRRHGAVLAAYYFVGMAPLSLGMLMTIDAVSAHYRSGLIATCWLMTAALFWRWIWLAVMQRRVQTIWRGQPACRLRSRLVPILFARLASQFAMNWGSFLIVPPFYGFFLSGIITPSLLENSGPATQRITRTVAWIHNSIGPLAKLSLALCGGGFLLLIALLAIQYTMLYTVLPSFLGIETANLKLTMTGSAWLLSFYYLLFLLCDFYWTIAAVLVYYDLQDRRLGSDLRVRLDALAEANP